ncbi:MAG: phosphomethylpyrimidine synthase ThiC [Candidatus Altiarchaeota archaeon]
MLGEVAGEEGLSESKAKRLLGAGHLVLVKNARRDIAPVLVGKGVSTKVNANVGTSPDKCDVELELTKARAAVSAGADAVMDLSIGGDVDSVRKKILSEVSVPLGTVPVYQAFFEKKFDMDLESMLEVIERQAKDGVDFMTIHAGITSNLLEPMGKRIIPITSRGGGLLASWMRKNGEENPFYEGFDAVLGVLKEYDVVLSLGDALRPGAVSDAHDECQLGELRNLGELTGRARKKGVQVIIEGPGHVPLNLIEKDVKLEKKICGGAPYYVLGPLVTDIGLGHDHITGAIGGAVAAAAGADFLCYVTPSEHLGLPGVEDVRRGVIASKIAAHAGDIVKYGNRKVDDEMSRARRRLDWDVMFSLGLDGEVKGRYPGLCGGAKECTMCGEYCVLKLSGE